jgi:hypothetical protein
MNEKRLNLYALFQIAGVGFVVAVGFLLLFFKITDKTRPYWIDGVEYYRISTGYGEYVYVDYEWGVHAANVLTRQVAFLKEIKYDPSMALHDIAPIGASFGTYDSPKYPDASVVGIIAFKKTEAVNRAIKMLIDHHAINIEHALGTDLFPYLIDRLLIENRRYKGENRTMKKILNRLGYHGPISIPLP